MSKMLNSAKCSYARELGWPYSFGYYDSIAEDALMDSTLITKSIPLPPTSKTTFFMVISPDGKLIASAHGDHCIYVCNVLDGRLIHRLVGHPRSPWALAFHPYRSDLLASGCLSGEVRVWDLKTGCSETLRLHTEDVSSASTSSSNDGPAVYTAAVAIASVAFHPDERLLAIAAADRLIFWDWSSKYPRTECRTATPRERVRYIKFDKTGVLYTGVTNSYHVTANGNDGEVVRPAMASTPPEVMMPHRCRELLTSRNEILQMRAELSRRHEQLLQRYNDLLRRYQDLRERYPDIQPSASSFPPLRVTDSLPPPPSPPPRVPPRFIGEGNNREERFISLMEENRRQPRRFGDVIRDALNRQEPLDALMSPILLERLNEPLTYGREMTTSSMQQIEQRHNLSYERLCRSYRSMTESAQRLVMEFQRVYGEYVRMKEEVRRRTGTLEPSRSAQYETGRAVLSTLAQMQVIMLSGGVPGSGEGPSEDEQAAASISGGAGISRWSEERRMHDRVYREARTLMRVHDLLLDVRHRLDFQADVVNDLRRGRDRLERLIAELNQTPTGGNLEPVHQRLITEIRHFKLFIRQWKQVVMSSLTTSNRADASTATGESSGGGANFVRLSLSPEHGMDGNGGPGPSSGNDEAASSNASATSTISKRVANVIVSPMRKRPSIAEASGTDGTSASRPTLTSIRLPSNHQPVVNLSPSRTIETRGPFGTTTYRYSYPCSPPHGSEQQRPNASDANSGAGSDHAVPIKRRRLTFSDSDEGASGSTSATTSGSSTSDQELNSGIANSAATTASSATSAGQASTSGSQFQRRDRPNIVLYVPRESSRMTSFIGGNSSSSANQPPTRSNTSSTNESGARIHSRRYLLVGSPPRFERVVPFPGYGTMPPLFLRQQHEDRFTGIRERAFGRPPVNQNPAADNANNNNNNDDEWEYSYDLNRAVNRAIAGAFIGSGDVALANNILDMTCRIQRWTTVAAVGKYPDLTLSDSNVIVAKCKLHNDGSVSMNDSGTLLAAFVENNAPDRTLWAHTKLKIFSLRPEDRGTVLYEKTFGPNAISISFSPANGRHIMVGLASRRYLRLRHSPQTCAMIFSLRDDGHGTNCERQQPKELKLAMNVEHDQRPNGPLFGGGVVGNADDGSNLLTWGFRVDSLNCATWLPTPGQGLCYGTNRGQVYILTPKRQESDEAEASDRNEGTSLFGGPRSSSSTTAPFQRQFARWNVFEDNAQSSNGEELISGNGNLLI